MPITCQSSAAVMAVAATAVIGMPIAPTAHADFPPVPPAYVENLISDVVYQNLGFRPDTVSCPDTMPDEVGATTRCYATYGGITRGVTATISRRLHDYLIAHQDYVSIRVDDHPMLPPPP
jgi:Domain of unknown function (DUF4333)